MENWKINQWCLVRASKESSICPVKSKSRDQLKLAIVKANSLLYYCHLIRIRSHCHGVYRNPPLWNTVWPRLIFIQYGSINSAVKQLQRSRYRIPIDFYRTRSLFVTFTIAIWWPYNSKFKTPLNLLYFSVFLLSNCLTNKLWGQKLFSGWMRCALWINRWWSLMGGWWWTSLLDKLLLVLLSLLWDQLWYEFCVETKPALASKLMFCHLSF